MYLDMKAFKWLHTFIKIRWWLHGFFNIVMYIGGFYLVACLVRLVLSNCTWWLLALGSNTVFDVPRSWKNKLNAFLWESFIKSFICKLLHCKNVEKTKDRFTQKFLLLRTFINQLEIWDICCFSFTFRS